LVSGNWTNGVGASFTSNGGTVVFDGTGGLQQLTSGGKAFNNLTILAGATLKLDDNLTVLGVLTNDGTLIPFGTSTVASVSPATGPTTGGTQTTIIGTNLIGTTQVDFGSVSATAFTVNSNTSITATAPAEAAGTVDVTVYNAGASATSPADHFTYQLPSLSTITVTPTTASVFDGTTQSFFATAFDQFGNALTTQPAFTWTVATGGAGGTVNASGDYTAPASGTGLDTVRASSGSVSGTASVSVTVPSATASFVGTDTTTQGNWRSAYGADGYDIEGDSSGTNPSLPSYASVSLSGATTYTWGTNTGNSSALQNVASTGDIASTWYSFTSFNINVGITDGKSHRVTIYALDWDLLQGTNTPRNERIDVLDAATGAVLDSRTLSSFQGEYVSWTISGNVTIQVTNLTASNTAVISGLFFGAAAGS
jgi:hypothetical protein